MNDVLKRPLSTSAIALMLAFGAMPAHAEMAEPNDPPTKAAKAEKHANARSAATKAADPATTDDSDRELSGDQEAASAASTDAGVAAEGASLADAAAPRADAAAVTSEGASHADAEAAQADAADIASPPEDADGDNSFARSKSITKSIATPHMTMSITRSKSMAKSADGDMAKAHAMAKAKALDTPGTTRTDTTTKATVKVDGDAEADAAVTADAQIDDSGMRVETFGETSVAVQ